MDRPTDNSDYLLDEYERLRAIASRLIRGERLDHTWQGTELVHEAFMKLCRGEPFQPNDREHFIRTMLLEMRRLLVDHARARAAAKRGANSDGRPARKLSYDALKLAHEGNFDEILNITDLICRLEQQDASKAEFVKLRYFVGLTLKETADALGISISTAQREWNFILAWLQTELAR